MARQEGYTECVMYEVDPGGSSPDGASADARILGLGDVPLLDEMPAEAQYHPDGWGELVEQGVVAGVVLVGRLVSIAVAKPMKDHRCDLLVHTLAPYRGRGFAMAAAKRLLEEMNARGLQGVGSTLTTNLAAQRMATKFGAVEIGRVVLRVLDGRPTSIASVRPAVSADSGSGA